MNRILVIAPNWLGDAVMAVPSVEAIRRQFPSATLGVAARSHLAPLYEMVPAVNEVLRLERPGPFGGWLAALRDARRLRAARFDVAILLPNSFRAAWIARRAGIAERWGYAADLRAKMLTRAVPRVRGVHQVEYYQRLVEALGIGAVGSGLEAGTRDLPSARVNVPGDARDWARQALARLRSGAGAAERRRGDPLVGMAPGAAYGGAKQWPPERYAELALDLARTAGVRTVLVGSAGDRAACDEIVRATSDSVINLCGMTDLRQLAAVIAECRTFVSNDSGAMHLAAAVGVPVVAIFGSTNEKETAPLPLRPGTRDQGPGTTDHAIVAIDIDCRPCMLRECPLEGHPCMTGIDVARVKEEVLKRL